MEWRARERASVLECGCPLPLLLTLSDSRFAQPRSSGTRALLLPPNQLPVFVFRVPDRLLLLWGKLSAAPVHVISHHRNARRERSPFLAARAFDRPQDRFCDSFGGFLLKHSLLEIQRIAARLHTRDPLLFSASLDHESIYERGSRGQFTASVNSPAHAVLRCPRIQEGFFRQSMTARTFTVSSSTV
jgi:hypothetical protein